MDNWAKVELYRWQHGELPPDESVEPKELDVPAALRAGADLLHEPSTRPSTFNVAQVLHFVAKVLESEMDDANEWMLHATQMAAANRALRKRARTCDSCKDEKCLNRSSGPHTGCLEHEPLGDA